MRKFVQGLGLRLYGSRSLRAGKAAFEFAYIQYKEYIEVPGSSVLKRYLERGEWAVDVGANIGFFTEKFARWVIGDARVIALEPEAVNYGRLLDRLCQRGLGDRVIAKQGAAADCDGPLYLNVRPGHPGDHRISIKSGVPISAWQIDTLLREEGLPNVGLIKIDVQGSEMMVLTGAAATIERCRPAIFIEIDERALRERGSSAFEVLTWLDLKGYSFATVSRSGVRAISAHRILADAAASPRSYRDVLALPTKRPRGPSQP